MPPSEPPRTTGGTGIWILLASVFAMVAVPFDDDRGVAIPRRYWMLHDKHLDGLAESLLKYREVHGTFPDNNQGLYALDTFGSRFTVPVFIWNRMEGSITPDPEPSRFIEANFQRIFWHIAEEEITRFHNAEGRLPSEAKDLGNGWFWDEDGTEDSRRAEVAITSNNQLFFLAPGCVLDPSLTPYVYENRQGLEESAFAGSIADSDWRRKFSRQPAPGIFVYSLNARDWYLIYRDSFVARYGRIWGASALSFGCWIMVFLRTRGRKGRNWVRTIPLVGGLLALGASTGIHMTCYVTSSCPRRRPESIEAQKRLLEKFHRDGVIHDDTYRKALAGFETETIFPSAGAPARKPD